MHGFRLTQAGISRQQTSAQTMVVAETSSGTRAAQRSARPINLDAMIRIIVWLFCLAVQGALRRSGRQPSLADKGRKVPE